jgi:DNA polymerase III delta subunit
MKVFLLHGDNIEKSYDRLLKYTEHAKKRSWEIAHYEEVSQSLPQLMVSTSLFGNEKLVIVHGFDVLKKKDLEWLTKHGNEYDGNIVIFQDSLLPKTKIKNIPFIEKIEEFVYPVLLWKMIENFYPGNRRQFLSLLHTVLEKEPIELVFGLLAKQVKELYWISIAEQTYPGPSWKKGKISMQAKKFSVTQLEEIIYEMAEIDIESKTSDSDMKDLLDLMVMKGLQ